MDKAKILKEIFENDPLGLLSIKAATTPAMNEAERLANSFREINDFYEKNNREPELGNGVEEHILYSRLKSIRENKNKILALSSGDKYGLLKIEKKKIESIDDVLVDDALGILNSDDEGIHTLKHVSVEKTMPDYIARRKPCKDFGQFEALFKQCQIDIAVGKRKLLPFQKEKQIEKGFFFVLQGVLLYIAEVGTKIKGKKSTYNARLRCIFDNGTESDILLRSLSSGLYKDGRRVSMHQEKFLSEFDAVTAEDQDTGFIYILKSENDRPEIKSIENLYKIGFSRTPIQDRIKNAAQDPTFLMAPVSLVAAYQCYNLNPQKLEMLIHTFFGHVCLNLDIYGNNGQRYIPREWFIVPPHIIEQAIHFLLNGEIVNYRYDSDKQIIVGK